MKENCFNFEAYSINGNSIYEGFGIDRLGGLFAWYYTDIKLSSFLKIAWAHGFALELVKGEVHIPVPPKTRKPELAY
jgi:hypothetical protein